MEDLVLWTVCKLPLYQGGYRLVPHALKAISWTHRHRWLPSFCCNDSIAKFSNRHYCYNGNSLLPLCLNWKHEKIAQISESTSLTESKCLRSFLSNHPDLKLCFLWQPQKSIPVEGTNLGFPYLLFTFYMKKCNFLWNKYSFLRYPVARIGLNFPIYTVCMEQKSVLF